MESLTQLIPTKCHVLRDGYDNVIDAAELVPGDIVLLSDGDRVPADIRLISSDDLKVRAFALFAQFLRDDLTVILFVFLDR